MSPQFRRVVLVGLAVCMVFIGQACAIARSQRSIQALAPTNGQPVATETSSTVAPAVATDAPSSTAVAGPTAISTPTPAPVSITAVGGNLAIRTGPSVVFDAIDVLKDGDSLPVYARSIQDGWLQVPIPSRPGQTGWVSTLTTFAQVQGYVLDLPMIRTVEWPFGGYLRNCTPHKILVEPGDVTLSAVGSASVSRAWFYPGLYTLYDADLAGQPEITHVALREHTQVDIQHDGSGAKWDCP